MQDPITPNIAKAIGMTAEECDLHPKKAARLAAAKDSDVPEPPFYSTLILGIALISGRIS
jgi:hypothetical protein